MAKSKEVATIEETGSALYNYEGDSGGGLDDIGSNELSIPFINILQKSSPEVEEGILPGAEPGAFLNTVTQEIIPGTDGFVFIPCHRDEAWVEWVPRVRGGGYVDAHSPDSDLVRGLIAKNGGKRIPPKGSDGKRIPFLSPDKNEVVETYYVYGLLMDPSGESSSGFAVLSFTSTKITKYKNWVTSMKMLAGNPPIFANRAKITTSKESRPGGTSFNFHIAPLKGTWASSLINPQTQRHLLDEAKAFREMILSGQAKADMSKQESEEDAVDPDSPF